KESSLFEDEILISFIRNPDDINLFLKLDDTYLWYYFRKWMEIKDDVVSNLSKRIIERCPPKMLKDITPDLQQSKEFREWYYNIKKQIEDKFGNEIIKYFFFEDDYKNLPYKDSYLLGETSPEKAERIWVVLEDNRICDIANISSLLKTLKNAILKRTRFYIDREYGQYLKEV
ncbi:MAG: hypothetical protein Q9M37_09315, partial [Desulfonauticus sp.]|nr:hypothetical protein [Desulfonauticus sp.]